MKRILFILTGIIALMVGLGFILPAVAWWRSHGMAMGPVLLPLLFGVGLLAAAGLAFGRALRQSQI